MKRRWIALAGAGLVVAAALSGLGYLARIAPSGTGYKAMALCSAVFISARDPASLEHAEFEGLHPLLGLIHLRVRRDRAAVEADLFGLGAQQAVFRPGLGCTLTDLAGTLAPAPPEAGGSARSEVQDEIAKGVQTDLRGVNEARLKAALDRAFSEPDPKHLRHTRAVLVLKDGRLIAERYAPGFSVQMPLAGYSMTKTMTGALAGVLVGRGLLQPDAPAPVPLWRRSRDPRAEVSMADLLHMTTGQRWSDGIDDPLSPVLTMMYHERDMAAYAAAQPIEHPPGSTFAYNSGSTNILARVMKTAMGEDSASYLALPRTALFEPAGMRSAVIAPDASGTLLGSTQGFATARDWLRFGELYLHDGARNGVQVLPKGWVDYSATPSAAGLKRGYGAQLWVNRGPPGRPDLRPRPTIPEDTLLMNGQFGQLTAVVPSRGVVIVRLGETHNWDFGADPDRLIADILRALD